MSTPPNVPPAPQPAPPTAAAPASIPASTPAAKPTAPLPRRILGMPAVLFVAICLLALMTLATIVLIFAAEIEGKTDRVVATVVVFAVFTGLLLLDMALSRRSVLPLLLGSIANLYILGLLLAVIWIFPYTFGLGFMLVGTVLWVTILVRALCALAWWLLHIGAAGGNAFLRIVSVAAASLLAVVAILFTLPVLLTSLQVEPGDLYWRIAVAVLVLAALAITVTIIVFWSVRSDARKAEADAEAEARAQLPVAPPAAVVPQGHAPAPQGWPVVPQAPYGEQPWVPQAAPAYPPQAYAPQPPAAPAAAPQAAYPPQPYPPQPGYPPAQPPYPPGA